MPHHSDLTAGPWSVDFPTDARKPTRIMGGEKLPGAVEPPTIAKLSAGTRADARVMAAGRDMLEALGECEALLVAMAEDTEVTREYPTIGADLARVRAAIAKAKRG